MRICVSVQNIYLFRSEGPAASAPAKRQPSAVEPALRKRTRSQPQDGAGRSPHAPPATRPTHLLSAQYESESSGVATNAAAEDARRDALRRIAHLRSGVLAESAGEAPEAERPSPQRQPGGDSAGESSPGDQPSAPNARVIAAAERISGPVASQAGIGPALSPFMVSQPGAQSQADNVAEPARLAEVGSSEEAAGQGMQTMELGEGAGPIHSSEEAGCMPVNPDRVVQVKPLPMWVWAWASALHSVYRACRESLKLFRHTRAIGLKACG